jgi:hypothetical protein
MVTPERELMADSREIDGLQPQERVEKLSKPKDKKEKKLKEISTNDVIDAHNFFEKFNGDFESMFGE